MLLAGILLIGGTTLTMGYAGMKIIHEFVESRFEDRMLFLARYLALNSELGILIDEKPILMRLARNLLSEKDVIRVTIMGANERVLAEAGGSTETERFVEAPVVLKETWEENPAFRWEDDALLDRNRIGKVRIAYSSGGIEELSSKLKKRALLSAVFLAIGAIVLFYVISRSLVAPLTRLVAAAKQVARGDFGLRAKPESLPEARELSQAFNSMLDSIEESRRALEKADQKIIRQRTLAEVGKFSMMIAHEVKNPLSIIKSSLDMLKREDDREQRKTLTTYIEDETMRLNRLIEDFLLFARPAVPTFRETDVNAMMRELVLRFEIQKTGNGVELDVDIPQKPFYIEVDPDLLTRALGNILKNAIEAVPSGGWVHIQAKEKEDRWEVAFEDEGEGIDQEHLGKIFEPFFTTRAKGTGLGLAFASQVIKTHGGTVTAVNNQNAGARFVVEIPIENPAVRISATG